jgi:guanylate kinase
VDFRRVVEEDCFVEYAKVHGHYYGTLKSEVQRIIDNNVDGIMDIDVQGAMTLQQKLPKASFIFILPPSLQALQDRLQKRGTEDPDKIKLRIKNSLEEVKSLQYFDYVVINDNIGQATNELYCIIKAERNKTKYFHSPF